jgi:hypothetical protein
MRKYTTSKGTVISKAKAMRRAVAGKDTFRNGKKIKCVEWLGNRYCDKGSRMWVKQQKLIIANPESKESIVRKQFATRMKQKSFQEARKKAGVQTLYEKCTSACTCKYNPHIVGWHRRSGKPVKAFKRLHKFCKN